MYHNNTSDSCRRFVSVLVVVVIGLCAATPTQAQTDPAGCERRFSGQRVISGIGRGARSVYAADLDGDGDADVLSASGTNGDKISWYENTDGLGTFGPQLGFARNASSAASVFAADLDGDGDIDVLSASEGDDRIAWYENTDGLGTFGPQQIITTFADYAQSVFATDLDGDGDIDVLSASQYDRKIAWYENTDGLGSFGPQRVITGNARGARSVFAEDLDGDGDTDVLSASSGDKTIAWYENTDGLGSFGPPRDLLYRAHDARSVFAADLDGDGDIDVLWADAWDHKVRWHENKNGLGTFGPQRVITDNAIGARSVFAADLDGDGDTDVLSASGGDVKAAWYENEADCNGNGVNDACDIADGTSADCTGNSLPDECEPDCNKNGTPDSCDLDSRFSGDCDRNTIPDECQTDCNGDGIPDVCESDCNDNGVPDACDILAGTSQDADGDGVLDECAFFRMVPVDPPPIVDPYPAGVEIVGSEIFIPAGGQRIWLEIKLGGWAPERLKVWQATINSSGYSNGLGAPLAPPLDPCVTDASCEPTYGFPSWCWEGTCQPGYQDVSRPDFVFRDGISAISTISSLDFKLGSLALSIPAVDDGTTFYGGTVVLDVPPDAVGTYVVGVFPFSSLTWMEDETHVEFPLGSAPARITVCATEDQPPCCLPSGACLLLDPDCCVAMGGVSSSTAIDCTGDLDSDGIPDACDTPDASTEIPTISTWGLGAIALLLLCGAKIAFGIRRTRRYTGLQ